MSAPKADIVTGERATCVQCRQRIGAVIDPYSGVVDWGSFFPGDSAPADFGCDSSPDTGDDGCGSHDPGEGHTPIGLRLPIGTGAEL